MEKVLPLSLMATKGGIESLISLCSTLIEDQKKRAESRFLELPGEGRGRGGLGAISGVSIMHMSKTAGREARVWSWGNGPTPIAELF